MRYNSINMNVVQMAAGKWQHANSTSQLATGKWLLTTGCLQSAAGRKLLGAKPANLQHIKVASGKRI